MQRRRQRLKLVRGAEVSVDFVEILLPIAMVGLTILCKLLQLMCDWRDPYLADSARSDHWVEEGTNRVKAHVLDIVQMVLNALPGASTVETETGITRRRGTAVCKSVPGGRWSVGPCGSIRLHLPVSQQLIDGS